jgi:5-methyltetrahydrofolate--homocysteine methyltransferase
MAPVRHHCPIGGAVETRLVGADTEVMIAQDRPTVLIGERINPGGWKRLAQALAEEDLGLLEEEAQAQAREGADVIDVHVGGVGIDEKLILPRAVRLAAETTGLPISIDTADAEALELALRVCPGKPLVNSVSGEESSLQRVLPLVKGHGAAVIGLVMDEGGIPKTPEGRLRIAEKILAAAAKAGISPEDVIIDPLALTVGADQRAALTTLEAIRLIAKELGVNMTLGGSNVSFGLPNRGDVNEIFLSLAIGEGVTCPIVNPKTARRAALIADLLLGRDEFAMRYIAYCRQRG